MYSNYTGIILAGGKSTRMGQNKSLMKIGDITVIERAANLLKPLFPKLLLITNSPEDYSFMNIETKEDIYKNAGPLAGIHSGLVNSETESNFIISCDIPMMTGNVIEFLIKNSSDNLITISKADNYIQQLCGVYKKAVIPFAETILEQRNIEERNDDQKKRGCSVLELVKMADSKIIEIEKEFAEYIPGTFYNMNSPAEFEFIRNELSLK